MTTPVLQFDFAGSPGALRFSDPIEVIVAHHLDEVRPAMRAMQAAVREGCYAAGFVSYEAAPAFDDALVTRRAAASSSPPLLWFGLFRESGGGDEGPMASEPQGSDAASEQSLRRAPVMWEPDITREAYARGIAAVKAAIAGGDTYQANYTFRLRAQLGEEDARAFHARLARAQQAPYSAYLDLGRWKVLSWSPELFFRLRGERIVTRPMKGTFSRGRWWQEDEAHAARLASSEKDRAENVMIVDLARNDVGRIAEIGSVHAPALFEIERYPSVFQMVSTVEGTVRAGTTIDDVFAALFPAGSITGAPKSSSMRVIAEVEASPRGVYCGAIGFVTPAGDAVFNVAIRTAVVDGETGRAEYGVGGGITWDSTAESEYAEALSKAAGVASVPPPTFELLETMRLERGVYARRDRHLARASDSAAYLASCGAFGTGALDLDAIAAALDSHARQHPLDPRRARLLIGSDGRARVESTPLAAAPASAPRDVEPGTAAPSPRGVPITTASRPSPRPQPLSTAEPSLPAPRVVALARTAISRHDRFLFHKTTNRAVYEAHQAAHPDALSVLLWNEARELTEFTIGNVVLELDDGHGLRRVTPPQSCGLLAGTFRAELLDAGEIEERVVTIDSLASAARVWLINSVQGWVEVHVRDAQATRAHGL